MSFKNITPEEYDRLIKNKNRIFDLTFKTPERINKYRNDKNIYDEIKYSEKQNKKIDNNNKILEDNFNKHLPKNNKNNENILLNTLEYVDNLLKQSNDSNDIDRIKNIFKLLSKKKDDNNYYINYDALENKINFDNFKKSDNENKYKNKHKFDNDEDIIKSFKTIFKENDIEYKPYSKSKFHKIEYLLDKLEYHDRIDKDLFNYFKPNLSEQKILTHKIPINKIIPNQDGNGLFNINKIKINTDLLNKNILAIRYLNSRKLTNKLLKDDYKISKNMVNAIKFNKNIHKLSKNEKMFIIKF